MERAERFDGLQILIVEDNFFIAAVLAQLIEDFGASVIGPAATLSSALELVEKHGFEINGASLDINLAGLTVFPVADALLVRDIPFIFSTGYDLYAIPEIYRDVPRNQKPVNAESVVRELLARASEHRSRQQE
jgi:CheY-like chemotaxis protein